MYDVKAERIYESGYSGFREFKKLSNYIVDSHFNELTEGVPLTEAQKAVISECLAIDMAMGASFKKPEYILTGIVIGATATFIVIKLIKTRRKEIGA